MPFTGKATQTMPEPDLITLEQNEDEDYGQGGTLGYPLQVCVTGPTYTQDLPTRVAVARQYGIPAANGVQRLLEADPRRKRARLVAATNPVTLGIEAGQAAQGLGFILPVGLPGIEWGNTALYVSAGTDAILSVIIDQFAD